LAESLRITIESAMGFAPFPEMEICPEFVPVLGQNNHF